MRELAAFASSDAGKAFARIEERWGRDPAASLESIDDVLAHNLRAALIASLARDEPEPEPDDPGAAARIGGERVREIMGRHG